MSIFQFKHFSVQQSDSAMKVGTDAMVLGSLIDVSKKKTGLDIGSGTGVLSLMVAQQNTQIIIDAIEIDDLAAEECETNFKLSSWGNRFNVEHADFTHFLSAKKYDLIFSNPPYHAATNLNKDHRKAQARHESSLPVVDMLNKVDEILVENGDFWVIIPFSEKERWERHAKLHSFRTKVEISIQGKPSKKANRVVLCFNRLSENTKKESICIRNEDNFYSDAYIELTRDFHAKDLAKS